MNWLIYISGWYFGLAITTSLIIHKNKNVGVFVTAFMWSIMWVWVCLKFIAN